MLSELLEEHSHLSESDISSVIEILEVAKGFRPKEVYLTGSSVKRSDYNDVDIAVNFQRGNYSTDLIEEYAEMLNSPSSHGTDPGRDRIQRSLVSGEIDDRRFDIFILEDNRLPSGNKLILHDRY